MSLTFFFGSCTLISKENDAFLSDDDDFVEEMDCEEEDDEEELVDALLDLDIFRRTPRFQRNKRCIFPDCEWARERDSLQRLGGLVYDNQEISSCHNHACDRTKLTVP